MARENHFTEIALFPVAPIATREEIIKLDDLSLALVGGGECPVAL